MPTFQTQQQPTFGSGVGGYKRQKPPQFGMQPAGEKPMYQRGKFAPLQAQQPMTEAGRIAQDQTTQGLKTGHFADVQSAQAATNRAAALKQYQAIQSSKADAVRGNLSAEQAQRSQDQSLAAANAQNLTAQNAVNALQRQYAQDAINRADTYENQAYGKATDERNFQTGRQDLAYSRGTDENRYQDSRGDTAFNQSMATQQFGANRQDAMFSQGLSREQFAANRADTAFNQGMTKDQFAANRDDALYSRGYQEKRDQVGDQRYERSYSDSRGDLAYNRATDESRYSDSRGDVMYGRGRDAVSDQRYNQEYADKRGDIGYDRGVNESRYQDTREDVKYERGYRKDRDAIGDSRYDTQYADQRGDTMYARGYQEKRDAIGDERYDDQTQYSRGRDAIGDERYDDQTQYSRGRDAIGDERYDQTYKDSRADIGYNRDEAKRLEGKGDVESLISSVQDPRAQNILRSIKASGGDVNAMYNTMMDNGTIKKDYRSASPGQAKVDAAVDEFKAMYPDKSDAEIQDMVRNNFETEQTPLTEAKKTRTQEEAYNRLATGKPEQGDFDQLESVNLDAVPKGRNVSKWLGENKTGGWVKIGNTPMKVVSGGRTATGESTWGGTTHTDYTVFQDGSGKKFYRDSQNQWYDGPPRARGRKRTAADGKSIPSPV